MTITESLLARIKGIANSATVAVVPVGNPDSPERALLRVSGEQWAGLRRAVVQSFGAAVIAAALAVPQQAEARGVGYDADVYGQAHGQVMQQGSGTSMEVLSTRQVKIELPQEQRSNNSWGNVVTIASGGLGAIIGNNVGGSSANGRQVGTIAGGVIGAVAGHYANEALNTPPEPKQIAGTEITMIDRTTDRVTVVTQAGSQHFTEGEKVLVVSNGGTARVIPDRGNSYERQASNRPAEAAPVNAPARRDPVAEIVRSADTMGIQVNPAKVASLLQTGIVPNEKHVGRVVGVDRELGLVYQELGRGTGTVHLMDSLSRIPAVGENISVSYKDGLGLVAGRQASRSHTR